MPVQMEYWDQIRRDEAKEAYNDAWDDAHRDNDKVDSIAMCCCQHAKPYHVDGGCIECGCLGYCGCPNV